MYTGFMRRALFLITILASVQVAVAQLNIKNGEFTGFDRFMIGDPVTKFDTAVKLIDSPVINGIKTYHYVYKIWRPATYQFGGVPFSSILLSFDEKKQLETVSFIRVPIKGSEISLPRRIRKDAKKLVAYIEDVTGKKAKEKLLSKFKDSETYGYDWDGVQYRIRISVYTSSKRAPHFSLDLAPAIFFSDPKTATKK